ncbi:MAG: hypothetical protein ACRDK7_02530 [Solirubrobacteraceae bacterium]
MLYRRTPPYRLPRETLPVELTERTLQDAVAVMGEWDQDGAQAAQSALEWMGWEGEGSLILRRYDVQLFAWYTLPRKFLTSLEFKREAADALARTLEQLGGTAASYAEVCRSADTDEMLCAWEAEDPSVQKCLRELLDHSGIEPPNTELLAWGSVMGLEEAQVREEIATALEEATEDGRLSPGSPGFHRRQAEVADAALRAPADAGDERSRLEVVHAERLAHWVQRGNTRGSAERSAIIEPVAALIAAEPTSIDTDSACTTLAPALWLLSQANDGIALTQTGAFNRAFVREVAERWPNWWRAELFGPPNRQEDLALLCELDDLLRNQRLIRRKGRQILTTARGRKLAADPPALLLTLARELLAGNSFRAACAELTAALILNGATADYSDTFTDLIHQTIVAEGWQADGEPPEAREVTWNLAAFLRPAEAIGLLEHKESGSRLQPASRILTDTGRTALIAGLRERALAPATGPY